MANPRQKKKTRRQLPLTRQNNPNKSRTSTRTKHILAQNPALAGAWDRRRTLRQNYRALGLASRLNGYPAAATAPADLAAAGETAEQVEGGLVKLQEAKIRRDPRTGAILAVLDASPPTPPPRKKKKTRDPRRPRDLLDSASPSASASEDEHESERSASPPLLLTPHAPSGYLGATPARAPAAAALEAAAAAAVAGGAGKKRKRTQSRREKEWLARLVQKHGMTDYAAMSRDRGLNVWQQTAADIGRRVRLFLEEEEDEGEER